MGRLVEDRAGTVPPAALHWRFVYPAASGFARYEDPGLGETESSLVLLARALAGRGHRIEVYSGTGRPVLYGGVERRRLEGDLRGAEPPDVDVAVRFP